MVDLYNLFVRMARFAFTSVFVLLFLTATPAVQAQFFNQDFETSTTLADYSSATPSRWQADHIGSTNITISHQTNPGRLRFLRSNNNGQAAYARTTDIIGVGSGLNALMVRFDVRDFNFPATASEVMRLQLGVGFNNNNAAEGAGKIFAEATIHSTTTADRFQVGNAGTAAGSASGADNARITVAANKSGANVFYTGPDGAKYTLATGRMDVWLGNTRQIDGADISGTAESVVTNFKFRFDYALLNPARIDLDDISLFPLYGTGGGMSGNYTVGRGTLAAHTAQFTSLTRNGGGFFEVLNFSNAIAGPMNFQVMTDITVENGANALNQLTGMSATNRVEVQPDGTTMRVVSGAVNNANGMIGLNGADYVVFDGREPSATGNVPLAQRYLTFRNTNAGGPTFHLRGDATFNTLQYCVIEGRDTDANRGVVMFGNGTTTGNDDNLIEYCDVKDGGGGTPRNGVVSRNMGTGVNDNGIIRHCNIYNIHNPNGINGIGMLNATSGWTIQGNSFYQTAARTYSGTPRIPAIYLNTTGDGFQILDNFMGGSAAQCGGTPWTANVVIGGGIDMPRLWGVSNFGGTLGTARQTVIRGNTFANFVNNAEGNAPQDYFAGVHLFAGNVLVENNTIGSTSLSNSLTLNANNNNAHANFQAFGVYLANTTAIVRNNTIGGGTVNFVNGATDDIATITGIEIRGNGSVVCEANQIGSATLSNSFTTNSNANIVRIAGINVSGAFQDISTNTIRGFSNLSTSANSRTSGIVVNSSALLANTAVNRNRIYGIAGENGEISGISVGTMNVDFTVSNNMISLGEGNTADQHLVGIYHGVSSPQRLKVVYNTIHIGGTVGSGSANSFGFYRGNNSTTPILIFNNVFQNLRAGGTGGHYAIGSDVDTNWGSSFTDCEGAKNLCNHNAYYVTATGRLAAFNGTDYNFAGWQGLGNDDSGVDLNPGGPVSFTSVATAQLYKSSATELRLNGGAYPLLTALNAALPTVTNDIDGDYRVGPDIGADEDLVTYTASASGDWNAPATWAPATSAPSFGDIVVIPAGTTVTVPDGTSAYFYRLQVAGTLEIAGTGQVFGCFSDQYGGSAQVQATGQITYTGTGNGILGLASSFEEASGTPIMGRVDFNVDAVPPPIACYLINYIVLLNQENLEVSLLGVAPATTIRTANLLNAAELTLATGKAFFVGEAATDLGALDLGTGVLILNGNPLTLEGDLLGTGTITGSAASVLTVNGANTLTAPLTFTSGGQVLQTLALNRTTGQITLGSPLLIQNTLTLTNGVLNTTATNLLTLAGTASVTGGSATTAGGLSGGSDASHINGPLRKIFSAGMGGVTQAFRFPVGNGSKHLPIGLAGLSAAGEFDAQYLGVSPANRNNIGDPVAVTWVSSLEHWTLNRVAGTASANVILHYNTASDPGLTALDREGLRIMHYPTGGPWTNMGNTAGARDITLLNTGWVMASTPNTNFSPFTWGNGAGTNNPLPVTLTEFEARYEQGVGVLLNWKTISESENEGFVLYRSAGNANGFEEIASYKTETALRGAGRSATPLNYQFTDTKGLEPGTTYYYQLAQVNTDGTETRLPVRMVTIGQAALELFQNYPNPTDGQTTFRFQLPTASQTRLELMDVLGRPIAVLVDSQLRAGMHEYAYDAERLTPGVYLARLVAGGEVRLIRVSVVR